MRLRHGHTAKGAAWRRDSSNGGRVAAGRRRWVQSAAGRRRRAGQQPCPLSLAHRLTLTAPADAANKASSRRAPARLGPDAAAAPCAPLSREKVRAKRYAASEAAIPPRRVSVARPAPPQSPARRLPPPPGGINSQSMMKLHGAAMKLRMRCTTCASVALGAGAVTLSRSGVGGRLQARCCPDLQTRHYSPLAAASLLET